MYLPALNREGDPMQLQTLAPSVMDYFRRSDLAMVLIESHSGKIIDANLSAFSLFGSDTLFSMTFQTFVPSFSSHLSVDVLANACQKQERLCLEACDAKGTTKRLQVGFLSTDSPSKVLLLLRDMTKSPCIEESLAAQKQTQAALAQSEARFRELFQNIPFVAIQGYSMKGVVQYWNKASEHFYGYTQEEALGKNLLELIIPPSMKKEVKDALKTMAKTGQSIPSSELTLCHKNGAKVEVFSSHAVVKIPQQNPEFFCIDIDIAERKEAIMRQQLAASVFTHAREGILITDAKGVIIDANAAFVKISGFSLEEIIGTTPEVFYSCAHSLEFFAKIKEVLKTQGYWCGEVWSQHKNGTVYPRLLTLSAVRDTKGVVQHYVALYADISHIKAHEQALEKAAYYDYLTDLPNRAFLMEKLTTAIAKAQEEQALMGVMYIDLDGFKAINDIYGHAVGDEILKIISKRLQAQLRQGDTLARLGGDEFVAILEALKTPKEYKQTAQRLLEVAKQPLHVKDLALELSVSIGVALYPLGAQTAQELLHRADRAMYLAKEAGKNRCVCD